MKAAIKRNAKIKWIESFRPMTVAERDILCSIAGISANSMVDLATSRDNKYNNAVNRLNGIFSNPDSPWGPLKGGGFKIRNDNGTYFAIDYTNNVIVNLNSEGFDVTRLIRQ